MQTISNAMNQGKTVLAQLISLLLEYELKKCINSYNGDFHFIKFTYRAQFTDRSGLRDIEAILTAFSFKLYHAGLRFVPKSILGKINEKKDWRIY